jgi:acyl-CoA reductase-like NAD-dependent aldehyde dehydrogenase
VGSRFTQFLTMFRAALESLKIDDPFDETTTLGPVSSEAALTLLVNQVNEAVAHGAKILTGGARVDRKGSFMQPTILTDIAPDNPAYRQEFFGPVALIFPAKDEEEAIAIANDSPFGLGGSIYTKNIRRGKQIASRIETGMVFLNYPSVSTADLPFGVIKRSGYGKACRSRNSGIRKQEAGLRGQWILAGCVAQGRQATYGVGPKGTVAITAFVTSHEVLYCGYLSPGAQTRRCSCTFSNSL